ncbi:hypothetical protein Taro_012795 [Colocasia esculenta]|uniref:Aminotransferase-like plant mobile domain-containing protein n=1 Tax=Colocasia esculenta TaxID=4460 RepID=A0A843UDR8_COLES|nr:hypothetical protein [Colocasia esculenta]
MGEGSSGVAHKDPPVVPMEEDTAAEVPGEDEPVGPKKLTPDVALIQALKKRWDPECHTFLFPWGHMIPTLEDVVRITGLRVDVQAVTGVTYTSYQELAERLLGLAVMRERSSLIQRTGLPVWAYHHLPSLGRGEPRWAGAMPLLRRWRFRRDEQSLRRQVTIIHDALDSVPFDHWTPYVGEDDAAQPWVERGRTYFGRDIWLPSFNTAVPLHHRLVARPLGLHQSVVEFPTRQRPWERPGRRFFGIQQETDWTVRVREQLTDREQCGREVASEVTSDEDYFRAYARRYGAQVYKGSRRPWAELDRAQQMVGGASSSREDPDCSMLEGQLVAAVARAEDALA